MIMSPFIPRRSRAGFTLVEMMVALFIFGMLASSAVLLLRFAVDSQVQSKTKLEEIAGMRRFSAVFSADMAQAVPRLSRDEAGQQRAAFISQDASQPDLLFRLTRGGWTNFGDNPRSSLQVVEYHLVDGNLERRTQQQLDGSNAGDGSVLVTGVTNIALRYRNSLGDWSDVWTPQRPQSMPAAVEMTLSRTDDKGAEPPARMLAIVAPNFREQQTSVSGQGSGEEGGGVSVTPDSQNVVEDAP